MERVTDSSGRTYLLSAKTGICYHVDTPPAVIEQLDRAYQSGARVRLFYGDAATGEDWLSEYDVTGTLGRSTGQFKIPLIIANSRSHGGPGLIEHCIVRMLVDGREVYRHPSYSFGLELCGAEFYKDGARWGAQDSETSAKRRYDFLSGKRMNH